jgi:hypothetical protein
MAQKRCPRCGDVYPRSARFCDQDGTELAESAPAPAPVERGRRQTGGWQRRLPGVLLLAAALVLLLMLAEHCVRVKVSVTLTGVEVLAGEQEGERDRQGGALSRLYDQAMRLAQVARGAGDLAISLRVRNETRLGGSLEAVHYQVMVGEESVAAGSWAPSEAPLYVPSGKEVAIRLPVHPETSRLPTLLASMLHGNRPLVRVQGDLEMALLGASFTVPFDVRRVGIEAPGGRLF